MASTLPEFKNTPVKQIPTTVERVRSTFFTHRTRPVEWRIKQLRKFYWAIVDHEQELLEACSKDLHKGFFETLLTEIKWVENDIIFVCNNLEKWASDEKPADIPLTNSLMFPKIRKDPLGVVLIIGAFNFPIQLSFGPLIGAISGGNTAILKPSENAPNCAAVMQKIVEKGLDPECFAVVQGGIPETQALLAEKWDKIFYTGSANVGKIVAKAAAPTLTPVTLELGGINPAFITKNANVELAAKRLLWGKTMNAGQVCISQNYLLVDKEVVPQLIEHLKTYLKVFYPNGTKDNEDYGYIVNSQNFNRIKKMLDSTKGEIVIGGTTDASRNYIEPTVVLVKDASDSLIVDESFGPLIPILPVDNLDEALRIANKVHSTPLGAYPFGNNEDIEKVLIGIRSGGASANDAFFHGSIPTLAFGGVGDSGSGSYRGKASFDCFVHRRSITYTPTWMERLLAVRYPPYSQAKFAEYARMALMKPNFDRDGNSKLTVFGYVSRTMKYGAGPALIGVIAYLVMIGYDQKRRR